MISAINTFNTSPESRLHADGYVFLPAAAMRAQLETVGPLSDWDLFSASWDDLGLDRYMADHGRYRRRRHAVYAAEANGPIQRGAHRAHFQSVDYNPLNGGIERWFDPVLPGIGDSASLQVILGYCRNLFDRVEGAARDWFVEVHQFRIEARADEAGLPTPEGMHRDGVDHVLVLLVSRVNIRSGTTEIGTPERGVIGSFTLTGPLDAALVEDRRVHHSVTPVQPLDPALPAHRDVLVVTFRRA